MSNTREIKDLVATDVSPQLSLQLIICLLLGLPQSFNK